MLTIHVGLHKTGSTSIQSFLRAYRAGRGQSLEYVDLGPENGEDVFGQRESSPFLLRVVERLRRGRDVVISSEGFLGGVWNLYPNALGHAESMLYQLGPHTDHLQIVIFVRPQVSWFESLYAQFIQEGNSAFPDEFLNDVTSMRYAKFTALVEALISAAGAEKVVVRPYTTGGDVVEDLALLIGVGNPYAKFARTRKNVSISPAQVSLLREFNAYAPIEIRQNARTFLQSHPMGGIAGGEADSAFSRARQMQLVELAASDWMSLSKLVARTRSPQPHAFAEIAQDMETYRLKPQTGVSWDEPSVRFAIAQALSDAVKEMHVSTLGRIRRRVLRKGRSLRFRY